MLLKNTIKGIIGISLGILFVSNFFLSTASGQAPRRILMEELTQASCPPCADQNPAYNALLNANWDDVTSIKYQVWWPGYDPMYDQTAEWVDPRVDYYGTNGVPETVMDGNVFQDMPTYLTQADIDSRLQIASPVSFDLSHNWTGSGATIASIDIEINITNVSGNDIPDGNKIRIAIIEDAIYFDSPPGTNGETEFYSVMRTMLDDIDLGPLTAGASFTLSIPEVMIPSFVYNPAQVAVVGWIQNDFDKSVMQSAKTAARDIPAQYYYGSDIAAMSPMGGEPCGTEVIPTVSIVNNGSDALSSYDVSYSINGGAWVVQNYTTALAGGASETITFPPVATTSGINGIDYMVSNFDGGLMVDTVNNESAYTEFHVYSGSGLTPLTEGFEGYEWGTENTDNTFLVNPDDVRAFMVNGADVGLTHDIGGFGNSMVSFRFDYWDISSGLSASLFMNPTDLSDTTMDGAMLTFSHAYAQYQTENDQLEVMVSTDCGDTWTTVWDKMGSDLATVPPMTSGRFYPNVDEWVSDTVDMGAYHGMDAVYIGFKGTSQYGNSLYLDDINAATFNTPVSIDVPEFGNSLKVFPNPGSGLFKVEVDLNNSNVQFVVTDLTGKVHHQSVSNTRFSEINLSDLANGIYLLEVNDGKRVETVKLIKK